MQVTYHRNDSDVWNWHQNIVDGFNLIAGDLGQANQHFQNVRAEITPLLPALEQQYHVTSITVPSPTANQLVQNAISLYGPNSRYYHHYNRNSSNYIVTVHGTTGSIDLIVDANSYVTTILGLL